MRYTPILLGAIFIAPMSYADVQLNGFLSAIGGKATKQINDDTPVRDYEGDFTFYQDSVFGLQARATLSDKLSMTGQMVSRGANDYSTELSWGYLAYDVSESTSVRFGRFRTPFYTYSDFLEVGYAYPWVSPSDEVYSLQFDNIDGVDVLYRTALTEDLSAEIQIYAGSQEGDFQLDNSRQVIDTNTRSHVGLVATLNYGNFSLRASVHNADLTVEDFDSIGGENGDVGFLKANLRGIPDPIASILDTNRIVDTLAIDAISSTFTQLGLKYDGELLFFAGEITNLDYESGPAAEQNRYHTTVGINLGNAIIYVGHSDADDDLADLTSSFSDPRLATLDDGTKMQLAALENGLEQISDELGVTSETNTIGIRYEFDAGAAFKVQYEAIKTPSTTSNSEDDDQGILRFGVDLVF